MPNHVHNKLTVTGPLKDRQRLAKLMKSKGTSFDFEKILPMPKSLRVTSGSRSDTALTVIRWLKGDVSAFGDMLSLPWVKEKGITTADALAHHLIEEDKASVKSRKQALEEDSIDLSMGLVEFGKLLPKNKEQHGATDWYGWANNHWGTKWNAYDTLPPREGKNKTVFEFDSAWSSPNPVIQALSDKFPTLRFEVWCDGEVDQEYGYAIQAEEECV